MFCGHGSFTEAIIKFIPDVTNKEDFYEIPLKELSTNLKLNSNKWNSLLVLACASNDFNPEIDKSILSYVKHNNSLKFIQQSIFLNYFFKEIIHTLDIQSIFNLGKFMTFMIHEGALELELIPNP